MTDAVELRKINPALEDLSREQLLEIQRDRLFAQLRRCQERIPFYRERWPAEAASCSSLEELRRLIPFTEKKDFVSPGIELSDRTASPASPVVGYQLTSGTTGLGQELHPLTMFDNEAMACTWPYLAYWAGLVPGDRICWTFPVALQTGGLFSMAATERMGLVGLQIGHYSSRDKLGYLRRFLPHAMTITPSYLSHLTALCEEEGLDPKLELPQLKCFFIAGESYTREWASRMLQFWGCGLAEWYGLMQFGGNLAVSCERGVLDGERRGVLHCMEHRVLCEILDPETDEEVGVGEAGELVITSLFREAFPVVRFRTGDRVRRVEAPCACGRPFEGIEAGTSARYDDMMKIRGQNVWPEAIDSVVLDSEEVAEYRGEVFLDDGGREQVSLDVELTPAAASAGLDSDALSGSLRSAIKSRTGVSMDVRVVAPDSLERYEFKVRRWTDRRREGRDVVRYTRSD